MEQSETSHPSKRRLEFAALLFAAIVFSVLIWWTRLCCTGFTGTFSAPNELNHYEWQANGWAAGYLGLIDNTGKPIAAQKNPRADSSYYGGRAHAYWGPLPTLIPLVFKNVPGFKAPSGLWLFAVGWLSLILFSVLVLRVLQEAQFPFFAAVAGTCAATTGLATCSVFLHVHAVNYVWNQSIACGALFVLLHLLVLQRGATSLNLLVAGFCLGLAILCKQAWAVTLPFLGIYVLGASRMNGQSWTAMIFHCGAAMAPAVLAVLALMAFNYARFEKPFESGFSFQNTEGSHTWIYPRPRRIPFNFYNTFLAAPVLTTDIPFFESPTTNFPQGRPPLWPGAASALMHQYPFVSFPFAVPLLAILSLTFPLLISYQLGARQFGRGGWWASYAMASGCAITFVNLSIDSSWLRYVYDPLFLWSAAAVWTGAQLWQRIRFLVARVAIVGTVIAGLSWQTFIGFDQTAASTMVPGQLIFNQILFRPSDAARLQAWNAWFNPSIEKILAQEK